MYAVDRGNDGLRALHERDPVLAAVRDAHAVPRLLRSLDAVVPALNVGAGTEALAGTGEDDGPDGGVVVVGLDRLAHLGVHGLAHSIELVGVVEGDDADAAAFFGEDLFVGHRAPPFAGGVIIAPQAEDGRSPIIAK
jgi:hypothetical protein